MKIAFDGRYAEGDMVGVGKYILNLVKEISLKEECIIFYSKSPKYPIEGPNIKSIILPTLNRITFEQVSLPRAFKKYKIDLYHATGNVGVPIFSKVPSILTIHDLIPLKFDRYFSYSKFQFISKLLYRSRLFSSFKMSNKIVTVSEYTRKELIKILGEAEKITVVKSGLNKIPEALPNSLITGDYVLNNGGIDIRKNLKGLLNSFALVHKKLPKLKLVITGENAGQIEELKDLTRKLKLESVVIFCGYVSEVEMSTLLKFARCLCYPSLIEGFGFPVLEAFSFGIPVVSSNISSIPEIAGDAAILVNPKKEKEIADAIVRVMKDNKLSEKLGRLGLTKVKEFSWKKAANEYLNLYNSI